MAGNRTTVTRRELEAMILTRCSMDDAFRAAFISDPAGTLAKHLGVASNQLPPIVVHEEPRGTWHLVVPSASEPAGALSDARLDQVSGGVLQYDGIAGFPTYPIEVLADFTAFFKGFK
jgi:hypothetical protein